MTFKSSESSEDPDDNPSLSRSLHLIFSAGLLSFVFLFSLYRYFVVIRKTRQYNSLNRQQNESSISKSINLLSTFVMLSYLLDCIIIMIRALESRVWTSTFIVLYDVISWFAWVINLTLIVLERKRFGKLSWVNLTFYLLSNITETLNFVYWYFEFKDSKPAFCR